MKIKIKDDDDYINIELWEEERIGYISLSYKTDAYYMFEDDFSEEEYMEFFPTDEFISLDILFIEPGYRGQGYAQYLMSEFLDYVQSKFGNIPIYLNSSSMDSREGMSTQALVSFYKAHGFKEILDEGPNVLMLKP